MVYGGFLYVYNGVVKQMYSRMKVFLEKKVEKSKIVPMYFI